MFRQQDLIDKVNEDFVKLKARMLTMGKEKIFQQSEKIDFAKKLRRFLSNGVEDFCRPVLITFLEMENIYDTCFLYYKDYKEEEFFSDQPEDWEEILTRAYEDYYVEM